MKKLKWICIGHGETAVCLVYDDGSFLNLSVANEIVYFVPTSRPETREYWTDKWPVVIDVT